MFTRSVLVATCITCLTHLGCSQDPATASARFIESGDRYASNGQYPEAAIEYRNAVKRKPESVAAHEKLADASARIHDASTVASELLHVADLRPDDVDAQLRAGAIDLLAGRFAGARDRAHGALRVNPASSGAYLLLGEAFAGLDDRTESEKSFREALRLNPADLAANRALALFYMMSRRADEAEPLWRAVADSPQGDPFALADYHVSQGRLREAERELRGLAARPGGQVRLAGVLFSLGNRTEAQELVRSVVAGDPRSVTALLLQAKFEAAEGRFDEALDGFQKALDVNPAEIEAAAAIAQLHLAAGHDEAAIDWSTRAHAMQPRNLPVHLVLVQALAQGRRLVSAVEEARASVANWPRSAAAHTQLAIVLVANNQPAEAEASLAQAIALEPGSPERMELLGQVYLLEQRNADARRQYEQVLDSKPLSATAANNLAWLYLEEGRLDEGLRLARAAVKELRSSAEANDTLGWIYVRKNRPAEAIAALAVSVDAKPENPLYLYHLGAAYSMAGETAKARVHLARALASSTNFPGRDEAVRLKLELDEPSPLRP